jgi:ribokinase
MFDIITVGSATIDCFVDTGNKLFRTLHKDHGDIVFVPFGSKITVNEVRFLTGGGGTNTAVSFARLGLKTAYIGKLGGKQSEMIIDELKKEGISTSLIAKGDDVGFSVILDAKGKDRTILTHKGSNNLLGYDEIDKSKLKTKCFYMASMVGKSYDTMVKLAKFAGRNKIKVAFNPSSYIANQGYAWMKGMLDHTDILILNKEEACDLLGKKYGIEQILKKLKKIIKGDIVVVTDGKKGCYCYSGDVYYFMNSSGKAPLESTGAGDSFGSAFVAGVIMGKDIKTCLQMGQVNAESVIMNPGAKNILLTYKQAMAMIRKGTPKIEIRRI